MSYQVLYRAWRPGTFSEICGQDAVVQTLRRQVVADRIAHAYLFCGTRGTGKTTASKVMAKAINCLHPIDGDPCCECEICRSIQNETCMDVIEIDAASNNGVDEIRELRERVKFPPSLTRYKVYIIDEVHMLSAGAFNALLKTLEEPPKHAVFILATTEPHKLLATILSRCQRFDFHRISVDTIVGRLKVVLEGIHREAEEEALTEIARAADGAMRDALSLLDCCLSYTDTVLTAELTRDVMGTTGRSFLFDFAETIIRYDAAEALRMVDTMMKRGSDPLVFAHDTVVHLRALLLSATVGDITPMMEITPEDAKQFAEQSKRIPPERLIRLLDLFMHIDQDMKYATRPRTVLELAVVRACHPEQEKDVSLHERLDRMEKMLENGAAVPSQPIKYSARHADDIPDSVKTKKPSTPEKPKIDSTQAYQDGIRLFFGEVNSMKSLEPRLQYAGENDGTVIIEFRRGEEIYRRMVATKQKELDSAMTQAYGRPMKAILRLQGEDAPAKKGLDTKVRSIISETTEIFGRENVELTD